MKLKYQLTITCVLLCTIIQPLPLYQYTSLHLDVFVSLLITPSLFFIQMIELIFRYW